MNICFVSSTPGSSLKVSDAARCNHQPTRHWRRMTAALKSANTMTHEETQREQWNWVRNLMHGEWVGTYEKRDFKEGRVEEPKEKGDLHYIIEFPEHTPDSGTWRGPKTADKRYQGRFKVLSYENFTKETNKSYALPGVSGQTTPEWLSEISKWTLEVNFVTTDFSRRMILAFYEPFPDKPMKRLTGFHICSYRDSSAPGSKVPIDESITPIDRIMEIPSLEPTSSMALTTRGGEKKYYEPTDEEAHFNNIFEEDRMLIPMRDSMFASVPEVIGENSELFFGMSTSSGAQLFGLRLDSEGIPCDWFTSMYGNHNGKPGKR
uniref:Uncharacterized protein n=1 Tax=Rhodosorus marinus TaxID=101924 RepID=A0A7S3A1B5_9RHOD|mmetsp:Transcript_41037/g.162288  ORF Transcript_41037/g.162288 Transcript_41037/m.162288 type:complete len:320 (+) Transcript_41037:184-1143(+)